MGKESTEEVLADREVATFLAYLEAESHFYLVVGLLVLQLRFQQIGIRNS